MNFLAHIYLSGDSEDLLIGNFIADFVKGKQYEQFVGSIQKGIFLHRQIDYFTDTHALVRQSTKRLQPDFGKFSGVVVDVFYDHFLAKNFAQYHYLSLFDFSQQIYATFQKNYAVLPARVQEFLPYMMLHNWLLRYADLDGISRSLTGIARRSAYAPDLGLAIHNLEKDYAAFENDFQNFFPELQAFVEQWLSKQST
jgi:acyl carrier protein phosphodiesterase